MHRRRRMPSRAAVAASEAASGAAEPASAQPSVQSNGVDSQARPSHAAPIGTTARKLRVRRCILAAPPRRGRVQ